ncbi:unnamed protein product [Caenorhabditis brenneri]
MNWIILFIFGSALCLNFIHYKHGRAELQSKNHEVTRKIRSSDKNNNSYEDKLVQQLPLKEVKGVPKGIDYGKFVVDRNDIDSLRRFISRRGGIIGQLTLKNFDTLDKVTDVWHHRLTKAAKWDTREKLFDFTRNSNEPTIIFDNCYDGWFPFEYFQLNGNLIKEAVLIRNPVFKCDLSDKTIPKYMKLVDRFGSFAVRIDHQCPWRYWNFDISNINVDEYDKKLRTDLRYYSSTPVLSLKLKGFESNITFLSEWLIKPFRLDWIREIGFRRLAYNNGCLIIEDTNPRAVFQLTELRQLHYDTANFKKSAPFVIYGQNMPCLNFAEKVNLFEIFGIVALHIIDSCPLRKKVLILDGRQPFDYVTNRDDVRFHRGDTFVYARIRSFTEEVHLKNLDKWFYEMGYHDVTKVGFMEDELPEVPEITVSGCISTFLPFPYFNSPVRNFDAVGVDHHPPYFYFRNNSGLDCENRRVINILQRTVGSFQVATSRDCECSRTTSSDFFWNHCLTHRGTLELTGSPSEQELLRLSNIRRIRDGQLWIHDTENLPNLNNLNSIEEIQCQPVNKRKSRRELSAVRVGGFNFELETVDLGHLSTTENCDRLVSISGSAQSLPRYSESPWMKGNSAKTLVNIDTEPKKCVGYSGRGGGMSAEFAHQLENCDRIEGDLVIDGNGDNVTRIEIAIQSIRRITGSLIVRNIDSKYCSLLKHIKYIDGDFTYENNPSLQHLSLTLIDVKGEIRFTKVPRFCLEIKTVRLIVEAFKKKQLILDCPFHETNMFDDFESRYGKLYFFTDLGIAFTFAFFVCYIMSTALLDLLKALNFTRWRKMTNLDRRLKDDDKAYLDESSSEEEPDVMTWKRKTMAKNRLDGRDIEGEKWKKEKKQYEQNRKRIKFSQKIGALVRTLERQESNSELSGQSWLRRKQYRQRKYPDVKRDENVPFSVLIQDGQTRWKGKMKTRAQKRQEEEGKHANFVNELNDVIKSVLNSAATEHHDLLFSILEMLEKKGYKTSKQIFTNYNELEAALNSLQQEMEKTDKKKWLKWVQMRNRLRTKALVEFGDGDPKKLSNVTAKSEKDSLRMEAGAQKDKEKRKNGMFAKVIVETMHWRPPEELIAKNYSTQNEKV